MSPAQLWANYKEDSKLKSKFLKYERKDDHTVFEAFVSSPDENGDETHSAALSAIQGRRCAR